MSPSPASGGLPGVLCSGFAWIDSIELYREFVNGPLFEERFISCGGQRQILGGLLVTDPPRNVRARRP